MTTSIDIGDKLNELVLLELRRLAERDVHGWESGRFKSIRGMQSDKIGDLGENFIVWLLEQLGKQATCTRRTDPTHKQWDIRVDSDNITLEVKTATLGYANATFQHEGLEQNRLCDGLIFFDIAPDKLYTTCFCKHTFDWSKAHRRRTGVQFKKDLSLKSLEENSKEITSIESFGVQYGTMLNEIKAWREEKESKLE